MSKELHKIEGFKVIELHPGADTDKDAAYLAREGAKLNREDFEREFLLKPVGRQDAYPVFPDYNKQHHENYNLIYHRHLQIVYRGWDFGKIHPCVEFLQPEGQKINCIYEIYGSNIYLDVFANEVLSQSGLKFPGARFIDWGDASGINSKDSGLSSINLLREMGILIKYRRQEVEDGIADISANLREWVNARPKFQLNPVLCPKLAEAMRGAYKRNPAGIIVKDGKNDHPVDAMRYAHQGIMFNINASIARSRPHRNKPTRKALTDSEHFTQYGRI